MNPQIFRSLHIKNKFIKKNYKMFVHLIWVEEVKVNLEHKGFGNTINLIP